MKILIILGIILYLWSAYDIRVKSKKQKEVFNILNSNDMIWFYFITVSFCLFILFLYLILKYLP